MRFMSRQFTLAEKAFLLFLILLLLGLFYFKMVDEPVRTAITSYEADEQMTQTQIDIIQTKILQLKNIKNTMANLEQEDRLSFMASYNNSKSEIAFLNDVLQKAQEYTITFENISRYGNQIRRNFTLQYVTGDYASAETIVRQLSTGEFRCLVKDIRCSIAQNGQTTISQTATFYETMVGGTADAGLPANGTSMK